MENTYQIVKDNYNMKPDQVAVALVDIITHIDNSTYLRSGPHKQLVASLDSCLDTSSSPDCILDVVEKVISVFISDSKALSQIAKHLEKKSTETTRKDIILANAFIHEVYLSSRGLDIGADRQKSLLREIKKDILRQQVVSEKNREMIASLESNLKVNDEIDAEQSEMLDKLKEKMNNKDVLDTEQSMMIEKLEEQLKSKDVLDDEQTKLIDALEAQLRDKDTLDDEQSKLIDALEAQLEAKDELDNQQTELINQLRHALAEKTIVDHEQSEQLEKLEAILRQKDDIDNKQTQSLLKIKEELISKTIQDIEHTSAIERLESRMIDMQAEIDALNRKFRDAGQGALDRDRNVFQRLNKMGVIVTIVVIYMVILSIGLFIR